MASKLRPRVLITNEGVPDDAIDLLRKHCDVIINEIPTQEAITLSKVEGVDAIFVKHPTTVNKKLIDAAGPQLKIVAIMSRGTNLIDTDELTKRGIKWENLKDQNTTAVADFAILLLLAASRRLYEGRLAVERADWNIWNRSLMLGQDMEGSTVGIVGLGSIGQTIIKRLEGFNVNKFLYTGHKEKHEGTKLRASYVSLNTLLTESDFVIISCPLTEETRGMCNADFFSKMKKNAVFVNIARGEIVEQPALIHALKNGIIFAAGLDVATPEPLPADDELLKLSNVVITPHMAYRTERAVQEMAICTAGHILKGLSLEDNNI